MRPEIKVGDRVRIIGYCYWDGHLGTVIRTAFELPHGEVYTVRLDSPPGALFGALPSDLEPIPGPAPFAG